MAKFFPGDIVALREERTSTAGNREVTFQEGLVGRVCKVHAGGTYCVQFPQRCLRVSERFLKASSGTAPECTSGCRAGC